jgi:sulfatase modifying factor 1
LDSPCAGSPATILPIRAVTDSLHSMVFLTGGSFLMGSDTGRDDERPRHIIELPSFHIARYAVTNRQYAFFLEESSTPPPPSWGSPFFDDPDQPVVAVNWFEANAFCLWLSHQSGERYRLPTEAEREFACRSGSATAFPWGDDPHRDLGEYGRRWSSGGPELVGGPANTFGLFNVADNVHEWCMDWYGTDYYGISPMFDPRGPESGVRKVARGGSWRHHVKVTRSAARSALDPSYRYTDFGFRIARSQRRQSPGAGF